MDNKATLLDPSLDKQLTGHRNAITALSYNPNELQIASGSLDNSVLLWDLGCTLRSYRFRGHDEAVMDVTFSPSGKYMASASRDKTVRLWVPTVTGSTGVFKAHSQTVRSVQFSADATKIVTASDDKIVKLWSSTKYKFISSFVGHTNWVRCARMSIDGLIIASCSDDKTTRLWNTGSGELIHQYKDCKGHGLYLAWHPSGCYIAIATSYGTVKLYDIRTHSLVQHYSIHSDAVTQLAIHPSGSYILTASKDGKMRILDLLEGHPIFTLSGHTGSVNTVSFSPSGDSFASSGDDKLVNLWKTNFTEIANEVKENTPQNRASHVTESTSKLTSTSRITTKGVRKWYLCYHSNKYPVANFYHVDDSQEPRSLIVHKHSVHENVPEFNVPLANSTLIDSSTNINASRGTSTSKHGVRGSVSDMTQFTESTPRTPVQRVGRIVEESHSPDCDLNCTSDCPLQCDEDNHADSHVGDTSHIPRIHPPKPSTYTIPSRCCDSPDCESAQVDHDTSLFGIVRLKPKDVCYTSGTIEWVGRKRSYPINTGFKTMNNFPSSGPQNKRMRKLSFSHLDENCIDMDTEDRSCFCTNILPTVNAIVDHLNALHEAVDLIDIRLDMIQDNVK